MATKTEPDFPSSPPNDESDGEAQESVDEEEQENPADIKKEPANNNFADILKRLQSSGALIKKPKEEYHCFTCEEDFPDWEELENHLIQHVQLPSVVIDKLPSDDEDVDLPNSEDEAWSDEEENTPEATPKTPQKLDISQILKKTGLSIKKPTSEPQSTPNSALSKLSGLGFTIKKGNTPIKQEPEDVKPDVMQKLGKLGGIKLKLKSDGNSNSFKVINGLKDFKTSDDEMDENDDADDSQKDKSEEHDSEDEMDKSAENEEEEEKPEDDESGDEQVDEKPKVGQKTVNSHQNLQGRTVTTKTETTSPVKPANNKPAPNVQKQQPQQVQTKPASRPFMKQTPKRGANLPLPPRNNTPASGPCSISSNSTPERSYSQDSLPDNIVVKKEMETESQESSTLPLFTGQIKTERTSPTPTEVVSTPMTATVKSEPEPTPAIQPVQTNTAQPTVPPPIMMPKTEDTGVTVIEINGDSNDEDDDCCVVSTTPAPDVKPVVPKIEPVVYPPPASSQSSYPNYSSSQPNYSASSQSSYSSSLPPSLRGTTEKQHSFDWNAPDSKPALDMLEKSTDDIFESLLSAKKESSLSISDANEYVSIDTLGAQHTCDVCNTRFTSISLLDDHRRITGHSRSLVTPSSGSLLPYSPSSNILQSLLPVKQMVEQVGKLSGMNSGPGFTHQQNIMINVQAYPGAGGVMVPPQNPYNNFAPGQNMAPGYPPTSNMYGASGQPMHDQFSSQNFMGQQGYGQYPQMSKPYPGQMPPNSYDSSPFSSASPLQGMQQTVYGQAPTSMSSQMSQMGPPPVPSNQYVPSSSPGGAMRPPTNGSGVRIQNIQTFPPGQPIGMPNASGPEGANAHSMAPGQVVGGQMPAPGQIRMATGAQVTGARPRMPNVRGQRPTIRPGIQVHGQIRGAKPRMPMKRPGNVMPNQAIKKPRPSLLLPRKHDNEDCQVMAMQKQRDGLPLIQSVQGANDKLNLGSQISITKKPAVNKEASAMANVLASRGISIKQKQRSRSPTPERPVPHIPNLGAGMSIKHTSKSSNFSIPEAKVGGSMVQCKICKKMFMNQSSLAVHVSSAHPNSNVPMFKCEDCPASYPKILQLQQHKREFHHTSGSNRELGLPVVDISQEENLQRLGSLGIYSFIPLAGRDGHGGTFAIPIISTHNSGSNAMQALGADGILSLGPLKSLPRC